jgi:phospholipase C
MKQIRHLIVLMMENRSFEHVLGTLTLEGRTDVAGFPNPLPAIPDQSGNPVSSWAMDTAPPGDPDPPHGWETAHSDYNDDLNDGFVRQYQLRYPTADPRMPMGYYTRSTLPVYYALARVMNLDENPHSNADYWVTSTPCRSPFSALTRHS